MNNIDIIYTITDLSADSKRKNILHDETKDGIINLVSNVFKKPLFKIYIKKEEFGLLEDKLKVFKFLPYNADTKYKMGDFLMTLEEAGEL